MPRCNLCQQLLKFLEAIQKNLVDSDAVALKTIKTVLGTGCLDSCLKHLANWAWLARAVVFSASLSPTLSVHELPAYACLGSGDLLWEEDTSSAGVAVGSVVAQYLVLNMLHVKPKRLQHSFLLCGCKVQVSNALNYDLIVLTFIWMVAWMWGSIKL